MSTNRGRSEYRQVADTIRTAIKQGDYARGTVLREEELAQSMGVDRSTINRAFRVLTADGLVRARRGKGTLVTFTPPIQRNATLRYSQAARERADGRGAFDAEVRALGFTPRSELTVSRVTPPANVAEILNVAADENSTVKRARRMYADDTAVQLADSYIPVAIAEGTALEADESGPGGIVSRFADLGLAQTRITESLNVRTPTPEEASFLDMTEDQRVYEITHTGWTADGQPVEVCVHVMPTHLWKLDYEWSADQN
ncbi:GntR family transcriptional regulator [Streptomyces sp. SID3343]|uniref:GntR family transcriptional regulator n=1 Tax=Streptomyces sp. SID3343 TaxID=2690260 RepID=UPI00136A4AE8|nr:GntR family transcriptional regulator [Streptomyces sp. SID3343]MYW04184.1 UTRA domain-containing protein [Streptomyces sp. SID3343]